MFYYQLGNIGSIIQIGGCIVWIKERLDLIFLFLISYVSIEYIMIVRGFIDQNLCVNLVIYEFFIDEVYGMGYFVVGSWCIFLFGVNLVLMFIGFIEWIEVIEFDFIVFFYFFYDIGKKMGKIFIMFFF